MVDIAELKIILDLSKNMWKNELLRFGKPAAIKCYMYHQKWVFWTQLVWN